MQVNNILTPHDCIHAKGLLSLARKVFLDRTALLSIFDTKDYPSCCRLFLLTAEMNGPPECFAIQTAAIGSSLSSADTTHSQPSIHPPKTDRPTDRPTDQPSESGAE